MARLVALAAGDPVTRGLAGAIFAALGFVILAFAGADLVVFLFSQTPDDLVAVRGFRDVIGLDRDGSFGETVCFTVEFFGAAMFLAAYARHRGRLLFVLGVVMVFILADDSLQYHERLGAFLVRSFDLGALPFVRAQDSGEILAWALAGAIFVLLLVWSLGRRRAGDGGILLAVFWAFALLVGGGIGLDMLCIALPEEAEFLRGVIMILEEAGEFFGVGALAATAFAVQRHGETYFTECAQGASRA